VSMRSIVLAGIAALGFGASVLAHAQDRGQISGPVVRVIDDGATGDRWLLLRDAADPGGPGRMVRVERTGAEAGAEDSNRRSEPRPMGTKKQTARGAAAGAELRPVIRADDALVVEEHTAVVDAQLEATALGSAAIGSEFEARLKIGGRVVRAIALGPGRAALLPKETVEP